MTAKLQMIGNAAILDHPDKVAFLSSRRISPADVLKCYEWAEKVRDTEQCVISPAGMVAFLCLTALGSFRSTCRWSFS